MTQALMKLKREATREFEQVVMAEVLIPDVFNTFFDISTREQVRNIAYKFAEMGYVLDVNHDNVDAGKKYFVCESFIARDDDPIFIAGSWVVGVKIVDPDLWQQVLDGDINGFSYEATMNVFEIEFPALEPMTVLGITEPHPLDGHTHTFSVVIGSNNQVISGGTGVTDGHAHTILSHTYTQDAGGHSHRYQVLED